MKKRILKTLRTGMMFLVWFTASQTCIYGELPKLIPRENIFGGGAKYNALISPNAKYIAYLAPSKEGISNVWFKTRDKEDDQMVTQEKNSSMLSFFWAYDNRHILYLQDSDGDENYHVFATDIENKTTRDLTPFKGVKTRNLLLDDGHPSEILVGLNKRDNRYFDMYRIDIKTGEGVMDTENPGDVQWWLADDEFVIRAAVALNPNDIGTILRVRDSAGQPWRDIITWPFGETGLLEGYGSEIAVAFTADGNALYIQAAFEGDHTQLAQVDAKTGKVLKIMAKDDNASIWTTNILGLYNYYGAQVLFDPKTKEVQAAAFYYLKPQWKAIDPKLEKDFEILRKIDKGIFSISSRDLSGQLWTVDYISDTGTGASYLYDRAEKKAALLFETEPQPTKYSFAEQKPVVIRSRDGVDIPCYLTLPVGVEAKNLPMVSLIHGGPWFRDEWGFDPNVQFLANRGYAVLQVNFRGSTGYGKKFLNAGNGQYGVGHMQNDVTDAVQWFIKEGVADPKKIAAVGGSYGGYAVLAGLTFTPGLYKCGIAMCGPSNLKTDLETMPTWRSLIKKRWLRRLGNVLEDDELNRRISPYYHAQEIKAPLLIFHGANDARVKIEQSNRMVNIMRKNHKEVVYVVYPDEGHGMAGRPQNVLDNMGRMEEFLAKYLGGRAQPFQKIPGSSAELR